MKIQEHPSIPENKLQRNQDADDQENSFVSEVPRLDLTALRDDNNWEGRIVWWLLVWVKQERGKPERAGCIFVWLCSLAKNNRKAIFVLNMELKVWRNWKQNAGWAPIPIVN